MKKLKTREQYKKEVKIDWDSDEAYETVWIKAKFIFDPKNIDVVRKSSVRVSTKEKVLSMNGKECLVEIGKHELGYELEKNREYDIVFKQGLYKRDYKLTVFSSELKLI